MTELQRAIVERIRRNGPMPFAAFMQMALYDPVHGYYSERARTDRRGHFLTSAELDPAFGACWARAFTDVWRRCGEPETFTIVEVGPGEGGSARAVLEALPGEIASAVRYVLVERMTAVQERQAQRLQGWDRVEWVRSVVDLAPFEHGVVFANEVFDNTPVHVVELRDGKLVEIDVGVDGDRLIEVALEPSNPELETYLRRCGVELAEGTRMEVGLASVSMARRLADIVGRGAVIFVDYGGAAAELAQRPAGTLVSYSEAGVDEDVLADPGGRDITSHVNWTAITGVLRDAGMTVTGPVPQGDVLRSLGIGDIDRSLRADHELAVREGRGADAVAALSRRQALRALVEPAGMGGFGVVTGTRGVRSWVDA